jgi:hypothetical protein
MLFLERLVREVVGRDVVGPAPGPSGQAGHKLILIIIVIIQGAFPCRADMSPRIHQEKNRQIRCQDKQ